MHFDSHHLAGEVLLENCFHFSYSASVFTFTYGSDVNYRDAQMFRKESHVQRDSMLSRISVKRVLLSNKTMCLYSCCLLDVKSKDLLDLCSRRLFQIAV